MLFYCHSVFARHLGSLVEDQVMGFARDEGLFARLAHVLDKCGVGFRVKGVREIGWGLGRTLLKPVDSLIRSNASGRRGFIHIIIRTF